MDNIKEKLDKVRSFINSEEFINGKGLSNEVNIRIFCYNPECEQIVANFINKIITNQDLNCRLVECNLYKIFLQACVDIDILDAITDTENADGSKYLLEQLNSAIGMREIIDKIKYTPHFDNDVLLITGIGDAFPFMRVHSLLEALQPHFSDTPILVMYPGEFNGRTLTLFNRLKGDDYYRAFNII